MKFAINRLDMSGPHAFAASARRAEDLGWSMGLIPCSPLLAPDPYVMLAFAAEATDRIRLGTMLDTPIIRHPAALASSIATVAALAPGRTLLGLGVGDTAVRLNGLAPATVASLERAVTTTRQLLAGATLDVGAARPAKLRHAQPAPVWIAAQGPKTLRMAGAAADGVFIRVGTHAANIRAALNAVKSGAESAGRSPQDIEIGLIFHTVVCDDADRSLRAAKACAAGYFEYSPFLLDVFDDAWPGPDVETIKQRVWPDFHHARDLEAAGAEVDFLRPEVARAFCLAGSWSDISEQLADALNAATGSGFEIACVLPHPMVLPGMEVDYLQDFSNNVMANFD